MSALEIRISKAATRALQDRAAPLLVLAELYFSCLIRKRLYFPEQVMADAERLPTDHPLLQIYFRPVMGVSCKVSATDKPPLTHFPIQKPQAFIPKWISIDFAAGQWRGEFGFA
jgi:hypothetical protein